MTQRTTDTKNRLAQVFITKLAKDSFREITIAEIAADAGCSRNTFYRHFKDKYDLLAYFFNQLLEAYLLELEKQQPRNFEQLLVVYFSFWKAQEQFVCLLRQQHLLTFALDLYSQKMLAFLETSDLAWHRSPDDERLVLLLTTGGCWNILNYHLQKDLDIEPELLAHDICRQIKHFQFFL
ncbi:TetR/AcrR family transcriptional regulator [Streptococcus dentiloxodontae]